MKNYLFFMVLSTGLLGTIGAMEIYSLKEALEHAAEFGVTKEDISVITVEFLKKANFEGESIAISKEAACEIIANLLAERAIPVAQLSEKLLDQKKDACSEIDPFQVKFESELSDFYALRLKAQEYDKKGTQKQAMQAAIALNVLHHKLDADLIAQSKNKWFLTSNLLDLKLRHMELIPVETEHGLSIPHSLKTSTPLYHLVSHHQIFNSCGFNSLANAYAVERQAREKRPITAACTRKYAEHCFVLKLALSAPFKSLLFEQAIEFADAGEITLAASGLDFDLHLFFISFAELKAFRDETTDLPITQLIKTNPAVHFIVNVGSNHWVLVSVVHDEQGYALYHLNSTNNPIHSADAKIDEVPLVSVISYIDGLVQLAK